MGAKDQLARGAKSATYFNNGGIGDKVELKNVAPEGSREKVKAVKKAEVKKDGRRLVPKNDQIIVQRREPESFSANGVLLLPDEAKERHAEGVVTEVAEKVTEVKKGDYILFGKYAGTEHAMGSQILLFMSEKDVIATVVEG